jgi:hypothetical protein
MEAPLPFPTEHAARQAPPERFAQFRRGHPEGFPEGVDVVWGIREDGGTEIQSLRFAAAAWTEAAAREWASGHGFLVSGFEPAAEGPAPATPEPAPRTLKIAKVEADKQLVFGWLYVCRNADGSPVVDHSGDVVAPEDMEAAAYAYTLDSRAARAMHAGGAVGRLVETVALTREKQDALGIPEGAVPEGWWVGYKIDDAATWERVKSGELRSFSLGGRGERRPVR